MAIQYVSDEVNYTIPNDTQTDYEADIAIIFCVENFEGSLGPELIYKQTVIGGTSALNAIELYNNTRSQINDASLLAYANSGNATVYTPPAPPAPDSDSDVS